MIFKTRLFLLAAFLLFLLLVSLPGVVFASGIHNAVEKGDLKKVRELVERDPALINQWHEYQTPLHKAAEDGNIEIAKFLISQGADLDAVPNGYGINLEQIKTPLLIAVQKDNKDMVSLLIKNKANAYIKYGGLSWALHHAKSKEVAKMLIENGAKINSKDYYKNTPLNKAAEKGHLEVVKLLISRGAYIDNKNSQGFTPLHIAAYQGYTEIAEILIRKGANIRELNKLKQTPLHLSKALEISQLLINAGADINLKDSEGNIPLYHAVKNEKFEIVKLLVLKGSRINESNIGGVTPLHVSLRPNEKRMTKFLLSNGANANAKDYYGQTPLHYAVEHSSIIGSDYYVKLLVENGADVNAMDNNSNTPLDRAINTYNKDAALISYLLSKGANINYAKIHRLIVNKEWRMLLFLTIHSPILLAIFLLPLILVCLTIMVILFKRKRANKDLGK